jgi:hypothetical protein
MTTTKHTHSIHIDAPVKKVFHYLEDPGHLMSGMAGHPMARLPPWWPCTGHPKGS